MPKSRRVKNRNRRGKKKSSNRGAIGVRFGNNRLPLPPRTTCDFTYNVAINLINIGATYANARYNPTFAYDVDPTLGSTAMPFFSELGKLYRYYRVVSSRITFHFSNKELFSGLVYICPVNFDPGINSASYQNYLSNPLSKHFVFGPYSGHGTGSMTHSASTADFAGSRWLGDADSYSARADGTGGGPTNSWFWMVGTRTDGNVFTAGSGVFSDITIHIRLTFFEEESPTA